MYFRIGPAVAGIGLERVVHDQSPFGKDPKALGRFLIVRVGFGNAVRKAEMTGIEAVTEGEFNEIAVRENLLYFAAESFVEPIVVVNVEKPAVRQIGTQTLNFKVREHDIAVAGEEEERIGEDLFVREVGEFVPRISINVRVLLDEPQKVDFSGGIVVPITAPAIFEAGDAELALDARLRNNRKNEDEGERYKKGLLHEGNVEIEQMRNNSVGICGQPLSVPFF